MKKSVKIFILSILLVISAVLLVACNPESNGGKTINYKYDSENDYYILTSYNGEDENYTVASEYKGKAVGRIKKDAFKGNSTVKTLIIPDSVEVIDGGALSGMTALKELTVPFIGNTANAVAELGISSFKQNISVNEERIFGYIFSANEYEGGASVTFSYDNTNTKTYYLPKNLATVTIAPKANYEIPAYAFCGDSLLYEVVLADNIVGIGEASFKSCANLNKIVIPKNVQKIYASAFYNCSALSDYKELTVGGNARTIGFKFEDDCVLTEIDDYAFANTAIKNLVLPEGVESIGKYCFASVDSKTSNITSVTFGNAIKTIGDYAFYKSNIVEVVLGDSASEIVIGKHAFNSCTMLNKFDSNFDKTIDLAKIKKEDYNAIGTMAFANLSGTFSVLANYTDPANFVFDNTDLN